jgi:hypothetical protein
MEPNEETKTEKEYMVTVYIELIGTYSDGSMPSEATLRRQIRAAAEDKGRLTVNEYKFDLDRLRACKCETGDDD